MEHSLKIFSLLLSLFSLELSLGLHLGSKSIESLNFLTELLLLVDLLSSLFLIELLVTRLLVIHDLLHDYISLLFFPLLL
jgi:hypothetical protein